MFYVSGNKIYLMEPEEKGYPEVELVVAEEGIPYLKKTGKFIAKKPVKRSVCNLREIHAKFQPRDLTVNSQ